MWIESNLTRGTQFFSFSGEALRTQIGACNFCCRLRHRDAYWLATGAFKCQNRIWAMFCTGPMLCIWAVLYLEQCLKNFRAIINDSAVNQQVAVYFVQIELKPFVVLCR